MPSSVTSSSLASIFTPLVSSTSADLPASLRYWRRLFSSEPMPADMTVSEKSSSSRSNCASTARLNSAQASMPTDVSLSIVSSISLPGVEVHSTTNISEPSK